MPKHLVFVCAVNRFRSVVAEYYLRELQKRGAGFEEIRVSSAGAGLSPEDRQLLAAHGQHWEKAAFGLPPYPYAIESMKRRRIDISGSRSKELTRATAERADLIVANRILSRPLR